MKLDRKLALAIQSIKSISTHDDLPTPEVEEALGDLANYIKVEKKKIRVRKAETFMDRVKNVGKAVSKLWL